MNNLQDDGWDLSDLKYVELGERELATYGLHCGDLLLNRTNGSKDLVGKCEVFREPGQWVFASYLIRVRTDERRLNPQFASDFLSTGAGRIQIDRLSRQIMMTNINAEELRAILLPLPPLHHQRRLVAGMDEARAERRRKLDEADRLLSGIDGFVLDALGLTAPSSDSRRAFAVRRRAVRSGRMDPAAHRPLTLGHIPPSVLLRPLGVVADIDPNRAASSADGELVAYVGLPECGATEVREVRLRPYGEVRGRSVVRPGDILFARIEPGVVNKKYVLVESLMGHNCAYTSTEFYVVRAKEPIVLQSYLYATLFCSFVHAQVLGRTTGSSGRRRIDPGLFAGLQIPVPADRAVQQSVAAEVERRRAEAHRLHVDAKAGWEAAKAWLDGQLLGAAPP